MATATTFTPTSLAPSGHTPDTHTQSPSERRFMLVAMGGAVLGAVTGATLAASAPIPELFGLFGTLLGSVAATGVWSLIAAPFESHSG